MRGEYDDRNQEWWSTGDMYYWPAYGTVYIAEDTQLVEFRPVNDQAELTAARGALEADQQ